MPGLALLLHCSLPQRVGPETCKD